MFEGSPPVTVELRDPSLERNRWTVGFRVILAIPHFIWWYLWGILVLVLLPFQWLIALIAGKPPEGLHDLYGAYIRYTAHLYAYMSMATNKYPGFMGEPEEYALDIVIPERSPQRRWAIFLRLILALPPLWLAGTLMGGTSGEGVLGNIGRAIADTGNNNTYNTAGGGVVLGVTAVLAWFYCVFRGRNSQGLRDLAVYAIGYGSQVYAYFALLTERYPDSTPALAKPLPAPKHPVRATLIDEEDRRRSRLTVFFRLLLAVPHLVWLYLWGILATLVAIVNWFAVLFTGRAPGWAHSFLSQYIRYEAHVGAFISITANPFPGFMGEPGSYPYDLEFDPPEKQNRWITFFRIFLVIPALFLSYALAIMHLAAAVGLWFASLFSGHAPRGLRDVTAFALRYRSQYNAYVYILTDRYPYSGPTLETEGAAPAWEPPTAPAESAYAPPAAPADSGWAPPTTPDAPPPPPPAPEAP
jgi:uncharacterized protein DUF4389